MMFALAVALGCDLFDSAAYALYARDGRYLTTMGTHRVADLDELPCHCPVCVDRTPAELGADEGALARHNLHVSFGELRRIRQAIREGSLFELLDARARGHPDLLDGYRRLLEHDVFLERHDPAVKSTFMHVSTECARRPEVYRHHWRLRDWPVEGHVILAEADRHPEGPFDDRWEVRAPFGPVPPGLGHTYPVAAEVPDRLEPIAYEQAAMGVRALVEGADKATFTLAHGGWPAAALEIVPDEVHLLDD